MEKRNKFIKDTAKDILDKMWEFKGYKELLQEGHEENYPDDYVIDKLDDYIRTQYLFESDYTNSYIPNQK